VRGAHIGDVVVHVGEPPQGNPYRANGLIGNSRKAALTAFKHGSPEAAEFTYWYAPSSGGARRITADEVDWESSGVE
jgi:hypothetical protein